MQQFTGREKHKYGAKSTSCRKCRALCCASRFSVSSSSSSSSSSSNVDIKNSEMVQARLERMITAERRAAGCGTQTQTTTGCCSKQLVVLIARDQCSYDPRRDFRDSMVEVITYEGMKEPKELRTLLNCYMSLNSREHRQVILEVFLVVCSSIFPVS